MRVAEPADISQQPAGDEPRWTDQQLAVFIELSWAAGYHTRRLRLGHDRSRLGFPERCRRTLRWLQARRPEDSRDQIWTGLDSDPVDLDALRHLPHELRWLRQPRGGAA